MDEDALNEWINDQLLANGWTKQEVKRGYQYRQGMVYMGLGGLMCIFVIGIPPGLMLFAYGAIKMFRNRGRGKEYYRAYNELRKESKRRDKSGAPLFDPVPGDFLENRLAN